MCSSDLATCTALQEALEEDEKKDTPSFGKEDLEEIHRSGTDDVKDVY